MSFCSGPPSWGRWDTSDVYAGLDDPQIVRDRSELTRHLGNLESSARSLTDDTEADEFGRLVRLFVEVEARVRRLHRYGLLLVDEDVNDHAARSFVQDIESTRPTVEAKTRGFLDWWRNLDDTNFERLVGTVPEAAHWLAVQHEHARYFLSPEEEDRIAIDYAATCPPLLHEHESIVRKYSRSRSQFDVDPARRRVAYGEMHFQHLRDKERLGAIYRELVRFRWDELAGPSGFTSPISFANTSYQLPDSTVETLLRVCEQHVDLLHRFCEVLAAELGLARLSRTDLFAPILPHGQEYSWPEVIGMAISAFRDADPALGELAERVYEGNHIDWELRAGKPPIAGCRTVLPDILPFIHLQFQGTEINLIWLAHELGHAVHHQLAGDRGILEYEAPTPLAEVASIFAELLLMDRRLSLGGPADRRGVLLHHARELLVATIFAAGITRFEIDAHDAIHDSATDEVICDLYKARMDWVFGEHVEVDGYFRYEWLSKEKLFEEPFGHYPYAFAALVALRLYGVYKKDKQHAVAVFRALMAAGNSRDPIDLLASLDFHVEGPDFWAGGFQVLTQLLDEADEQRHLGRHS